MVTGNTPAPSGGSRWKLFGCISKQRLARLLKKGVPYKEALEELQKRQAVNEDGSVWKRHSSALRKAAAKLSRRRGLPYKEAVEEVLRRRNEREVRLEPSVGDNRTNPDWGNNSIDYGSDLSNLGESGVQSSSVDAAGEIRIGLVPPDYPDSSLSLEQLSLLKRTIMEAVGKVVQSGAQVCIERFSNRHGWMLVTCPDEFSAVWLEGTVINLSQWQGVELTTVRARGQ